MLEILAEKLGGKQYITGEEPNGKDIIDITKVKKNLKDGKSDHVDDLEFSRWNHQYKVGNRKSKRAFVEILIEIRQHQGTSGHQELESWRECTQNLDKLDYWIKKRNKLIHDGRGFSENRINELNDERRRDACDYHEITKVMSHILTSPLLQLSKQDKQRFIEGEDYYLYTDLRNWVREKLFLDMRTP
ncbi:MAG: hypothetical protein HC924_15335 [Synechococcaceae cyanobacterium SM2_3_2]|nr:hypothetical protein [Synechococcaceae cyanobacterium SM2_3_2]